MKPLIPLCISVFILGCSFWKPAVPPSPPKPPPPPPWLKVLDQRFTQIESSVKDGVFGVLVSDPQNGFKVGRRFDRPWYLASTVKVPIAAEVLRQIETGLISYEHVIHFNKKQRRDGSGEVSNLKPGTPMTVRYLLEQMLIHSDNAATDILIDLVGIENINKTLQKEVPNGFKPITSLLDVRRHAYKELHPLAMQLDENAFIRIKAAKTYKKRYLEFSKITRIAPRYLRFKSIEDAFESYYKGGLNNGTLTAYSSLLAKIYKGELISPFVSKELLSFMSRCKTGSTRIKAGLPETVGFAHKTGTQIRRLCDMGILTFPDKTALTVTACVEKWRSMKAAESILAEIGRAIAGAVLLPSSGAPKLRATEASR